MSANRLNPGLRALLALVLWLSLPASPVRADRKTFAHVYPYFTQPEGGLELEWWVSAETQDLSHAGDSTLFEQRVELEYGLTDHWDLSIYEVFDQPSRAPAAPSTPGLVYDSTRVETRYRFGEPGEWPLDVEAYGELERPANLDEPTELETKLILERDFAIGRRRILVQENLIDELKLARGQDFGYRLASSGGVGIELSPIVQLGVELLLNREQVDRAQPIQDDVYLGPSLSVGMPRGYLVLTPAFHVAGAGAIDDRGHDLRFRLIYSGEL